MMMQHTDPNQNQFAIEPTIDESGELQDLEDGDLDDIFGAGCQHGHGKMSRYGRGRGSQSSFRKRSRSISGQTITKPDGTSITSFNIQEEEISSESSEMSYSD